MHVDTHEFNLSELHFGLGLLHDQIEVCGPGEFYLKVDEQEPWVKVKTNVKELNIRLFSETNLHAHDILARAQRSLYSFFHRNRIVGRIQENQILINEPDVRNLISCGQISYENYERKQNRMLNYAKDFE